jgi:prevent-host-death family protein
MKTITITELQSDFDNIITQVENGKSFIVKSEYGNVALVPYDEYKEIDELVKIYTDHEEGS